MSDGPSKAAPEAEPLDDIILGDDDATQTDARPPLQLRPSQPPKIGGSHPPAPAFRPSSPPARFPGGTTPPPQRFATQPPQPDFLTSAPAVRSDRPSTRPSASPRAPSVAPGAVASSSVAPGSVAPGAGEKRSSGRMRAVNERDSQGRRRARMTLRIPDDEVARPTPIPDGREPATTPSRPPSAPSLRPVSRPPPAILSPDDTIELPADELRARVAALTLDAPVSPPRAAAPSAPGVDRSHERGWTPFQPTVAEDEDSLAKTSELPLPAGPARAADAAPITPMRIVDVAGAERAIAARVPMADEDEGADEPTERWQRLPRAEATTDLDEEELASSPASEEIPVEMDIDIPEPGEEGNAITHRFSISDEIKIEEAPLATSDEVRHLGERPATETGEVEVAPEDLVSVESLPPGTSASAPPVKTAGKFAAFKEDTAVVVDASTGAPQQPSFAPASRPQQPSRPREPGGIAPLPPASSVASSPSPAASPEPQARPANVAARTSAARRQSSSPLVFAPPVGGLAPPPMTDTAAMRKKTRPWWEELFNDDFIRTMAKVSEQQIGKEVTFIEESLGCEPGAMILDLACGTGRHAVELAARGYQVVGFDLSLAMLARASDEAQDRKQKINFVQGDMREMTFEETFDGVYAWNTSFGFFDETQNNTVVARLHKSLKKGGQLLLDVVNRDFIVRQAPSLAWFEGDGCICMDEMTIDFITSRMKVKRTLMMDDGRTKEIEYSIRIYALHELGKMLHDNGFRVAEVSGRTGTPGVFFGCESPRTLILAEKR